MNIFYLYFYFLKIKMNKKQNVIKNKDNNIFQKIKSRILQENDKKIVVVQKGKKKEIIF
jgi:uncharacterized ion transporter superfamily protein YfcC